MNIYIDESGSFVNASNAGSWNAVAALAVSEKSEAEVEYHLNQLKISNGFDPSGEIKLKNLTESSYLQFIENLAGLNIVVFSTATDAGLNTIDRVIAHQKGQVTEILRHIDKMKYEGVQLVSFQLAKIPPQLYVQLLCQVNLMFDIVSRVINYYAHNMMSPVVNTYFKKV